MTDFAVLAAVAALVMLFVLAEIVAAVLPVIIVVTLVPPAEREGLAKVIAACDSSSKLRVWSALRVAVRARRAQRREPEDPNLNRHGDLDAAFGNAGAPMNHDQPTVSGRSPG